MSDQFFDQPILNSPYEYPAQHWELDDDGQPTQHIVKARRVQNLLLRFQNLKNGENQLTSSRNYSQLRIKAFQLKHNNMKKPHGSSIKSAAKSISGEVNRIPTTGE